MKKASILMRKEIARLQPRLSSDINTARKAQDAVGNLESKVLSGRIHYVPQSRGGVRADFAVPKNPGKKAVILYLHGGGYTAGNLEYARGFGGVLADLTGLTTLCLGYRLAPENPYPAALDDALEAYLFLLEAYDGRKIFLAGESAGGGLCYSLCIRLRELKLPMPAAVVAISPWTDLTLSFPSHREKAQLDPSLTTATLDSYAEMYAGSHRSDPLVSPVFGNLGGLPDSLIFVGSHEILMDDSVRLAEKLNSCGSKAELHVEEGGWHTYVLYAVYEARQALKKIKTFIKDKSK